MNERITLISKFDKKGLSIIEDMLNKTNIQLCKVPFGKNVDNRIKADTLPYHLTLYAWDIKKKIEVIDFLNTLTIPNIRLQIDKIDMKRGSEDSYVIYFSLEKNNTLTQLQTILYRKFGSEFYNPNHFKFHITIHITKDNLEAERILKILQKDFKPFSINFNQFELYEIYPAKLIKTFPAIGDDRL